MENTRSSNKLQAIGRGALSGTSTLSRRLAPRRRSSYSSGRDGSWRSVRSGLREARPPPRAVSLPDGGYRHCRFHLQVLELSLSPAPCNPVLAYFLSERRLGTEE